MSSRVQAIPRPVLLLVILLLSSSSLSSGQEQPDQQQPSEDYVVAPPALRIGDECQRNRDCDAAVPRSRCELGYCACQAYFAPFNGTRCLESKLLGKDCLVDEQCTLRVGNSTCRENECRCLHGYLEYHGHTCLPPAKLGQICYSNKHCQLWDSDTHCDFLLPDLFGRCQCTAPMRQDGDVCRPDELVRPAAPMASQPARNANDNEVDFDDKRSYNLTPQLDDDDAGAQLSWLRNATMLLSTVAPTQLMPMNLVTRPSVRAELQPNELPVDDSIVVEAENTELAQSMPTSIAVGPQQSAIKTDRHDEAGALNLSPVSLGQACFLDLECKLADPNSRCHDGACDCALRASNGTWCSARRTGCAPGTFQCRATGQCISWYFVCDGKQHCPDGSDEECQLGRGRSKCPEQAFKCHSSGRCVSRAALCDGVKDCPNNEDEQACGDRRRCPEGAFRCNNGQCLPAYEFCNAVVSCRDGSDEPRAACRTRNRSRLSANRFCPFRCANGRCRSDAITCSGKDGCGDNSDEIHCNVCKCPPLLHDLEFRRAAAA